MYFDKNTSQVAHFMFGIIPLENTIMKIGGVKYYIGRQAHDVDHKTFKVMATVVLK